MRVMFRDPCDLLRLFSAAVVVAATDGRAQARQFELDTPAAIAARSFEYATSADVDGDGDLDLIGGAFLGLVTLVLLRNDGAFGFSDVTATQLPTIPYGVGAVQAFDADQDGDIDLFVSGMFAPSLLLRNLGNGSFVVGQTIAFASSALGAVSADLDGDGDLDLAVAGSVLQPSINRILVNDGTGTFLAGPLLGTTATGFVGALDFDGDSDVDLAFGVAPLQLWRNHGNLVFVDVTATHVAVPTVTTPGVFAVGDLDGDGDPDAVLGANPGSPDMIVRNVSGVLTAAGSLQPVGQTQVIVFGDVDRDGDLDVVRAHGAAGLSLALNDGTGAFVDGTARLPALPVAAYRVHLADLDRDADLDLVACLVATPVRALRNRHVDLHAGPPVIGQNWLVTLGSEPGYATQVHICRLGISLAALPQPLALPGFGELWLDLAGLFVLVESAILPSAGQVVFPFAIPSIPALAGLALHVQGLVEQAPGPARLTAWLPVTIQ